MSSNEKKQDLFLRSCSAWQFGDWMFLSLLDIDDIKSNEDKDVLFGMHINSLLQLGLMKDAREKLSRCSEFGVSLNVAKRFIVSSTFNSLANFQALNLAEKSYVDSLYSSSIKVGMPVFANELAVSSRYQYQRKLLVDLAQFDESESIFNKNVKAGALYFKAGESSPLRVPESEGIDFTEDFTIQFLLRLHSWPNSWTQVISKFVSDKHNEFCFRIKDFDSGQFFYGDGQQVCAVISWAPKNYFQLGEWVSVTLVKSHNNILRLYFDGVLCAERDIAGMADPVPTVSPVYVMGSSSNNTCIDGDIADVRYSLSVKTTEQIYSEISSYDESDHLLFKVFNENSDSGYVVFPTKRICADNITNQQKTTLVKAAKALSGLDYLQMVSNLGKNKKLNIVVVGANDGKINDPLYPLMVSNTSLAKLLLIEPQTELIPYLKDNYHFHPDVTVVNAAVGPESELILYSIKKELWAELDVPYAKERNWPLYRAPTGVTSSSKEHVLVWLKKHLKAENLEDCINKRASRCQFLDEICHQHGFFDEIDVLQIDTEGFDDQVIYSSSLEVTKPKVIHFESAHLIGVRADKLYLYLERLGYSVHKVGDNTLAMLNCIDV